MKTLLFNIDNATLSRADDASKSCGKSARIKFTFSGEFWGRCKAVAVFDINGKEYAVPIKPDRTCDVPVESVKARFVRLRVVGAKGANRVTTNTVFIMTEG